MVDTGTTPGDHDRFPGFDAMGEVEHWDGATRAVVMRRLTSPGSLSFFDVGEEVTARALCDRLLAQDDEPRVPVVEEIDDRLRRGEGDGYRYDDMPEDWDAWKRSLAGLDDDAQRDFGRRFADLDPSDQRTLIEEMRRHNGQWHGMPAQRTFGLWMRYATTAFYAHPWAWNEMGFPGPAYPRGYKSMAPGRREPFEMPEGDARDPVPWARRVEAAHRAHGVGPSGTNAS